MPVRPALLILIFISTCLSFEFDSVPEFIINFDEDPSTRYNQVNEYFKDYLLEMENLFYYTVQEEYRMFFEENKQAFKENNGHVYYAMESLAELLGLPVHQTLLVNSIVDFYSYCTSIVARDSEGHLLHARNLDFDYPDVMVNLVYLAKYQMNGEIVAEAPSIAGYVGAYTGLKEGKFSITYNVRHPYHENGVEQNLKNEIDPNFIQAQMLIQDLLLHSPDYQTSLELFESSKLVEAGYFILAGMEPGEGVIIARDNESVAKVVSLDDTLGGGWFIAQTNEDWWQDHDPRYDSAFEGMLALGQDSLTFESIVERVLWIPGVAQSITIFSASMSARENFDGVVLYANRGATFSQQ